MSKRKNILLCPLPWGLGHTTRLWAFSSFLRINEFNIFWLVNGKSKQWINENIHQQKFNDQVLESIDFEMKHYGRFIHFVLQIPLLLFYFYKCRKRVRSIVEKENIDAIVSDHHFGAYAKNIPCFIIAHQLWLPVFIQVPRLNKWVNYFHTQFFKPYRQIWIPDADLPNSLAGKLTINKKLEEKAIRIGFLSHLKDMDETADEKFKTIEVLCIVSGPEPFRGTLLAQLLLFLNKSGKKAVVLSGDYSDQQIEKNSENVILIHATGSVMKKCISIAKYIIATGGYSTIMDLKLMQKKAILIPTPGQPEQIYLKEFLINHSDFHFIQLRDLEHIEWNIMPYNKEKIDYHQSNTNVEKAIQSLNSILGGN